MGFEKRAQLTSFRLLGIVVGRVGFGLLCDEQVSGRRRFCRGETAFNNSDVNEGEVSEGNRVIVVR
jgi:hypothetical protein